MDLQTRPATIHLFKSPVTHTNGEKHMREMNGRVHHTYQGPATNRLPTMNNHKYQEAAKKPENNKERKLIVEMRRDREETYLYT